MEVDHSFRDKIYELMKQLPQDKVITYGDLAGMAGHAHAARIVGGVAHFGPTELPWHRVVNRSGGLAAGFPGGPGVQQQLLEGDGISCTDLVVDDFEERRWKPGVQENLRLL